MTGKHTQEKKPEMRIRQKLTLGYGCVALLIIAVGYICLLQLDKTVKPLSKDIPETIVKIKDSSYLDGLAQFIRYYDEVLTQSARNYAFTQDEKWEQRYKDVEPKLDKIINEAIARGDGEDKEFFSSVNKANLALVKMECESIELVNNEQAEEAIKILESDEYWNQKGIYEQGLRNYVRGRGAKYDEAFSASTKTIDSITTRTQNLIWRSIQLVLIFVAVSLLLTTALGMFVSHCISSPLAKLEAATVEIGKGNLNTKVEIESNDEIGQLAASFSKMSGDLKKTMGGLNREISDHRQTEEALRESENKYKMLLRSIPQRVFYKDWNSVYVLCNKSYADDLGIEAEEIKGKTDFDFHPRDLAEKYRTDDRRIIQSGKPEEMEEKYIRDGEEIVVHTLKAPVTDKEGNIIGIFGIFWDVTERKKTQDTLEDLNSKLKTTVAKLATSNSKLREFVHMVVHDLKTPLRAIATLACWISTDYRNKLDEQGQERLNLLVGRVERIDKLIDSMLQYSRINRDEQKEEETDLNMLLTEVVRKMELSRDITVTIEDALPTIVCEEMHMMQVFRNLLDNAVKYMDKPQGRIKIGCAEENGFWKFGVSDNGPGIEEKYFEKVFKIFQTLSPRDKFESTGVGLAAVKRIVELYGGEIWLESKLGEGSTFFFTLPRQETGVKNEELKANITC